MTGISADTPTSRPLGSQQSAATASSLALVGAIVTTVANFVIAYLVSRSGGASAGVFWTATATITILGNSASLGTMTGLVYFLPKALEGDQPNPRALIELAVRPVIVLGIALAVILLLVAPLLGELIAQEAADDLTTMLRVLAVTVPAWAITQTLLGATRGLGTMGPTVGVGQVLRPGGQIALLGVLFAMGDPTPSAIAVAWGLPIVVGLFVAIVSVARLGGFRRHGPARVERSEYWSYTRFRAMSTTMQIALERIDVIVVSALLGPGPAGVYGSLSRYISAGNFLIFSVGQAMSTHLRRAIAGGEMARARMLLQRTTGWVVLVAWPYFLLVATKPEPLARLISDAYGSDAEILPILAVGMMVSAFAGPIDLTLLMLGRSQSSLAGMAIAMATDIVLLFALAPPFGLVGAAIAWSAAVAVQNVVATLLVHRDTSMTQVAQPSLFAAAIALVAVIPVGLVTPASLVGLVVAGLVAGLVCGVLAIGARDRIGLGDVLPDRIVSRLPAF